ncbi:MAG TPA: hypothetical protein VIU37_12155, partial [Candidatus Limnocylindrales bacterium]
RLLLQRVAPPQLLAVRNAQFMTVSGQESAGRTPLALAGHRLRDFNISLDGTLLATLSEDNRLEVWDALAVLADEPAQPTMMPALPGALLGFGMDWLPGREALLLNVSEHGLHRLYTLDVRTGVWTAFTPDHLAVVSYWPAPDSRHVAVVGQQHSEYGLWIFDLESEAVRRILEPGNGVIPLVDVTWSPDTARLAVAGQPTGSNLVAVWVVGADGTGLQRITPYAEHAVAPMWSPDGAWIAYLRDTGSGQGCWVDLSIVRPDGSDRHLVLRNSLPVAWAADSSGLILESDLALPGAALGAMVDVAVNGTVRRVILPLQDADVNSWLCHPNGMLSHWYRGTP